MKVIVYTIFLQPTDKEEIANIISSLNSSKASGPNSIPYRILFLLKNDISKQLADLFNLCFLTGFPSVLKTAKVVLVFKKDSKLDYSNYCPISAPCYQILKKYLKNLCIKDFIPFSITTLFITYSLDLDNNILHLMP